MQEQAEASLGEAQGSRAEGPRHSPEEAAECPARPLKVLQPTEQL